MKIYGFFLKVGWIPWTDHCRHICEFCKNSDKFNYGVVRLCHPECMDQGTRECKNDPQCKEGGNYRKCRILWSNTQLKVQFHGVRAAAVKIADSHFE